MNKTVVEIMSNMDEFVKTAPTRELIAFSGFSEQQYKSAQESTSHWLKLLRGAKDLPTRDTGNS